MPIDDRTTNRNYQLPNAGNFLADDVARLRAALTAIDADVFARYTKTETDQKLADLINGAPGALDTLNELAAAMGNDPNFAATITNALAGKPGFPDVWTRAQADARYLQAITQAENVFTGTGSQTTFTLTQAPPSRESLLVSVDGVMQPTAEYTLSGTALILSEAPASGARIRALMLGVAGSVQSASTLSFAQAGTGAVTRTVESKLRDVVSVKDFGAVGDGVTDDTAAIQAAITAVGAAGGGVVYFPRGIYAITSALNVSAHGIVLVGHSRWATLLLQKTLNAKILNITGIFCGAKSLSFIYWGGTPAPGATAIYVDSAYVSLEDFVIRSSHIGIHFAGGNAVAGKVTNFEIFDYESSGLIADGLNDLFVSKFLFNAGNTARGTLGGIRLINKVEGFFCSDGDILLGTYPLTMDTASFVFGARPAYNNFANVFFDSGALPALINKCVETEFIGCWFSNGRSGGGNPGATVSASNKVRFTNCRFFNCGSNGCAVDATAVNTSFTSCSFESNSVTSGPGLAHGISFAQNTSKFQLVNCTANNGLCTGTQGYGIFIDIGCSNYSVIGNNVQDNVQAVGLLDAGSQPKTVYGNVGFKTVNSGIATINSGATAVVVNHGLDVTPNLKDITLTRTSPNAGSVDLYPTTITSTQFTINTAPAPSSPITVAWSVRNRDA